MPFSGPGDPGLPSNVKKAPEKARRQWVAIVNQCLKDGGSDGECFRKANGVALAADLETRDFLSVPILETGDFDAATGPVTFSRGRIDDIVEAARANPSFAAPIKLGHNKDQDLLGTDGIVAAGWVQNLRRIGDTLIADLLSVPKKIADLIEVGGLKNRSVEVMFDFDLGGKTWPVVLTGLALLGAKLPAVNTLDDIIALYASAKLDAKEGTVFSVGQLGHLSAAYIHILPDSAFASRPEGGTLRQLVHHNIKGKVDRLQVIRSVEDVVNVRASVALQRRMLNHLSEHARRESMNLDSEIRTVSEALMEKELRELLGLGESGDVLDAIKGLVKLGADLRVALDLKEDRDILEGLASLKGAKTETQNKPSPTSSDKDNGTKDEAEAIATLQTELSATQKTVLELQGSAGRSEAEALVNKAIDGGQLLPAQREVALKLAITSKTELLTFLESQPKGLVELGERGSTDGANSGAVDMEAIKPTEAQLATAEQMGILTDEHRISLMRANAAAKQIKLPADFGQKKEEAKA